MWHRSKHHLASVGEGYFEHGRNALWFALQLLGAGVALLVHAMLPGWFQTTGSRTVFKLNAILQARTAPSGPRREA